MPSLGPPLWPAGHLPLKGGDWMSPRLSPITKVAGEMPARPLLISPLAGGEEWSAKRTQSQLLGFAIDERPRAERGAS